MKVHKDAKIEKVAAKRGQNRELLEHINVVQGDPDQLGLPDVGRILASNGFIAASVPCTLEPSDVPGLITPESLTMCRKLTRPPDGDVCARMVLDPKLAVADNSASFPRKNDRYIEHNKGGFDVVEDSQSAPDEFFGKPFPNIDGYLNIDGEPIGSVTLNVKHLLLLSQALGSSVVTLKFFKGEMGCLVTPDGGEIDGAIGALALIKDGDALGFISAGE